MEFKGGGLKNGIYLVNSLSVQTPCTVSDPFTCAALPSPSQVSSSMALLVSGYASISSKALTLRLPTRVRTWRFCVSVVLFRLVGLEMKSGLRKADCISGTVGSEGSSSLAATRKGKWLKRAVEQLAETELGDKEHTWSLYPYSLHSHSVSSCISQ